MMKYGEMKKIRRPSNMLKGKKIGVIGTGKMGTVLIDALISRNIAPAAAIIASDKDKEKLHEIKQCYGVHAAEDSGKLVKASDVIILAVKPQNMLELLAQISASITKAKLVISIAAGIPTHYIEGHAEGHIRVIRTMPNTPAVIGEGATALTRGKNATESDLLIAKHIFDAVGISVEVPEELMDAVTGLSGSGPAYVFLIIEALSDAGVHMGLSRDIAVKLAAQTLLGAAKLCLSSNKHLGELKDMVTSPAGTTIAGLKALEDGKLRAALMAAVESATLRSKELGREK
jgi:pyrroline-5-carboxylate reductase